MSIVTSAARNLIPEESVAVKNAAIAARTYAKEDDKFSAVAQTVMVVAISALNTVSYLFITVKRIIVPHEGRHSNEGFFFQRLLQVKDGLRDFTKSGLLAVAYTMIYVPPAVFQAIFSDKITICATALEGLDWAKTPPAGPTQADLNKAKTDLQQANESKEALEQKLSELESKSAAESQQANESKKALEKRLSELKSKSVAEFQIDKDLTTLVEELKEKSPSSEDLQKIFGKQPDYRLENILANGLGLKEAGVELPVSLAKIWYKSEIEKLGTQIPTLEATLIELEKIVAERKPLLVDLVKSMPVKEKPEFVQSLEAAYDQISAKEAKDRTDDETNFLKFINNFDDGSETINAGKLVSDEAKAIIEIVSYTVPKEDDADVEEVCKIKIPEGLQAFSLLPFKAAIENAHKARLKQDMELETSKKELTDAKAAHTALKADLEKLSKDDAALQTTINDLTAQLEIAKAQSAADKKVVETAEAEIKKLTAQLKTANEDFEALKAQSAADKKVAETAEAEIKELTTQLKTANEDLEALKKADPIASASANIPINDKINELTVAKNTAEEELEQTKRTKDNEIKGLKKQINGLKEALAQAEDELQKYKGEIEKKLATLKAKKEKTIKALEEEIEKKKTEESEPKTPPEVARSAGAGSQEVNLRKYTPVKGKKTIAVKLSYAWLNYNKANTIITIFRSVLSTANAALQEQIQEIADATKHFHDHHLHIMNNDEKKELTPNDLSKKATAKDKHQRLIDLGKIDDILTQLKTPYERLKEDGLLEGERLTNIEGILKAAKVIS